MNSPSRATTTRPKRSRLSVKNTLNGSSRRNASTTAASSTNQIKKTTKEQDERLQALLSPPEPPPSPNSTLPKKEPKEQSMDTLKALFSFPKTSSTPPISQTDSPSPSSSSSSSSSPSPSPSPSPLEATTTKPQQQRKSKSQRNERTSTIISSTSPTRSKSQSKRRRPRPQSEAIIPWVPQQPSSSTTTTTAVLAAPSSSAVSKPVNNKTRSQSVPRKSKSNPESKKSTKESLSSLSLSLSTRKERTTVHKLNPQTEKATKEPSSSLSKSTRKERTTVHKSNLEVERSKEPSLLSKSTREERTTVHNSNPETEKATIVEPLSPKSKSKRKERTNNVHKSNLKIEKTKEPSALSRSTIQERTTVHNSNPEVEKTAMEPSSLLSKSTRKERTTVHKSNPEGEKAAMEPSSLSSSTRKERTTENKSNPNIEKTAMEPPSLLSKSTRKERTTGHKPNPKFDKKMKPSSLLSVSTRKEGKTVQKERTSAKSGRKGRILNTHSMATYEDPMKKNSSAQPSPSPPPLLLAEATKKNVTAADREDPGEADESLGAMMTKMKIFDVHRDNLIKRVAFGATPQVTIYTYSDPRKLSGKWYSKPDLKMLLEHEIRITILGNYHEGKKMAKHTCLRGLEQYQMNAAEDVDEHRENYIKEILEIQKELRKQLPSLDQFDDRANKLRKICRARTAEDRKKALQFGLKDAHENEFSIETKSSSLSRVLAMKSESEVYTKTRLPYHHRHLAPSLSNNLLNRSLRLVKRTALANFRGGDRVRSKITAPSATTPNVRQHPEQQHQQQTYQPAVGGGMNLDEMAQLSSKLQIPPHA